MPENAVVIFLTISLEQLGLMITGNRHRPEFWDGIRTNKNFQLRLCYILAM